MVCGYWINAPRIISLFSTFGHFQRFTKCPNAESPKLCRQSPTTNPGLRKLGYIGSSLPGPSGTHLPLRCLVLVELSPKVRNDVTVVNLFCSCVFIYAHSRPCGGRAYRARGTGTSAAAITSLSTHKRLRNKGLMKLALRDDFTSRFESVWLSHPQIGRSRHFRSH